MKHQLYQLLNERNIQFRGFDKEDLYWVGMANVVSNIEYYYDKTYTCESVIKELFIRGIEEYIKKKNGKSV